MNEWIIEYKCYLTEVTNFLATWQYTELFSSSNYSDWHKHKSRHKYYRNIVLIVDGKFACNSQINLFVIPSILDGLFCMMKIANKMTLQDKNTTLTKPWSIWVFKWFIDTNAEISSLGNSLQQTEHDRYYYLDKTYLNGRINWTSTNLVSNTPCWTKQFCRIVCSWINTVSKGIVDPRPWAMLPSNRVEIIFALSPTKT